MLTIWKFEPNNNNVYMSKGCFTIWHRRQRSIESVYMYMTLELKAQLKRYLSSISQHSTNQTVPKFDIRNWIWLVKKIFLWWCSWLSHCQPLLWIGLNLKCYCNQTWATPGKTKKWLTQHLKSNTVCMFSMLTGYFTIWLTDAFKKHRGVLEINKVHTNILSQAHINIWWSWSADSISSDVGSRDVTPFHPSSSTNHLLKAFSVLTRSPFGLTK